MNKVRKIEEKLAKIEQRLAAAEAYIARNVNIEGTAFLHSDDWNGKSGHPLWMKNFMVPTTKRDRARKERALEAIKRKCKENRVKQRRRPRGGSSGEGIPDFDSGTGSEPGD